VPRCPVCRRAQVPRDEDPVRLGWVEMQILTFRAWVCPGCAGGMMGLAAGGKFLFDLLNPDEDSEGADNDNG
jgi:hypothetical protein